MYMYFFFHSFIGRIYCWPHIYRYIQLARKREGKNNPQKLSLIISKKKTTSLRLT